MILSYILKIVFSFFSFLKFIYKKFAFFLYYVIIVMNFPFKQNIYCRVGSLENESFYQSRILGFTAA